MDLNELQLKLEEMDFEPDKIDEVLGAMEQWDNPDAPKGDIPVANLELMREYETDWRKRAIIAAEIVKRGLDT